MAEGAPAVYWDSSAVLAGLTDDPRQALARSWLALPSVHCLSSLAVAESAAVLERLRRDGLLTRAQCSRLHRRLGGSPWRPLRLAAGTELMVALARRCSLRGADLWHLATARSLADALSGTVLFTFDRALAAAAAGEGLAVASDATG
ncbi:MAG TPA: PIN domain-containing protein [Candidatus Micrarchaeia archaeon]|nr:PIN domain-containing protein [Candidatus Micrarchaeia archaeon]